jgi:hypothetical protein
MITHRVLPVEEWGQVAHLEPFASGGLPDPRYWRIVVVERDGAIVAMSSLFDSVHWDLFFVAEADRGNPVVFKELLEGGVEVMDAYEIAQVHTTIPSGRTDLANMLERFGFERAPGDLFFFVRR